MRCKRGNGGREEAFRGLVIKLQVQNLIQAFFLTVLLRFEAGGSGREHSEGDGGNFGSNIGLSDIDGKIVQN